LNDNADDVVNDDDCAELDCDDESFDVFGDHGYDVVSLRDKRSVADLNFFGNDFAQSTSDREEDTTIILDSEMNDFQINPPPSQRRRVSIDPHDMHVAHVQFWNFGICKDYSNKHIFSQQPHIPSPHNSYTLQSPWL
jgi:hypothetical protein